MCKMKAKKRNGKLRSVVVKLANDKLSTTLETRIAKSRWTKIAK